MQHVSVSALALLGLGVITSLIGIVILLGQFAAVHPLFSIAILAAGLVVSVGTFIRGGRVQKSAAAADYELKVCPNCHKEALTAASDKNPLCFDCERKRRARWRIVGLTFLLVIALPLTLQLTQQNQDIRERASEKKNASVCDPGVWQPEACACGTWESTNACDEDEFSRSCTGQSFCCKTPESGVWDCRFLE